MDSYANDKTRVKGLRPLWMKGLRREKVTFMNVFPNFRQTGGTAMGAYVDQAEIPDARGFVQQKELKNYNQANFAAKDALLNEMAGVVKGAAGEAMEDNKFAMEMASKHDPYGISQTQEAGSMGPLIQNS